MSKTFLSVLAVASICLLALPARALDPRAAAGNSQKKVIVGNDQNRTALPGFNVLGGGGKNVDRLFTNRKIVIPKGSTLLNAQSVAQKREADKAYTDGLDFQKQGKLVDAGLAMRKSLTIRETSFGTTDNQIPVVQEKLAEIWLAMGKQDEAVGMFKDAMASYAKFHGPGSDHRIKPLINMGNVYMSKSDYKSATDCFNQAYMLTQRSRGANSPDTMKLRLQLAACNRASKSLDVAASLYNECFDLQKKNEKLINRDELIAALQDYAIVLKDLKKDAEAQTITARIQEMKAQDNAPSVAAGDAPPTTDAAKESTPPSDAK